MDQFPRRSTVVKAGILCTFLVVTFEFRNLLASKTESESTILVHPHRRHTTMKALDNTNNAIEAAPDIAKLLLPILHRRSLAPQEHKYSDATLEDKLDHLYNAPEDFFTPSPKKLLNETGRDMNTEECLYVYGSLVCERPQPIPKNKALNRALEDDFTKEECLQLWGHMICDPMFVLLGLLHEVGAEDQEKNPKINSRLDSNTTDDTRYIPMYRRPIPEDLLYDVDLGRDMTMQDCSRLWKPIVCEYYFKYVEEKGRSEYDCSCDPHFRKRFAHSPSCCHKKMEHSTKYISHTTKKFEAVKHLEIPRWENGTQSMAAACQSTNHTKFIHMEIDERVYSNCTYQNHITRTALDVWLPPHECRKFKPRESREFKRCLSVSEIISSEAITVYVVFCVIGTSVLGLLLLACVRRRKRSMLPLQDSDRFKGTQLHKNYPETRSIESGFDGYARSYDNTVPYQTVGTTLDGANDGWTKWILGKSQNEKRSYPPRSTPAPRIPSLRLPKPTFATVRRASGLEPAAPPPKSRSSTSKILRWGSGI